MGHVSLFLFYGSWFMVYEICVKIYGSLFMARLGNSIIDRGLMLCLIPYAYCLMV
jgi:hypothetical protein